MGFFPVSSLLFLKQTKGASASIPPAPSIWKAPSWRCLTAHFSPSFTPLPSPYLTREVFPEQKSSVSMKEKFKASLSNLFSQFLGST